MTNLYFPVIVRTAIVAAVLLAVNSLLYHFTGLSGSTAYVYHPAVVFGFFFMLSAIILGVLVYLSSRNKEQMGYAFLLLTGVKLALAYVMARPVIAKGEAALTEKVNFFAIFVVFLIIEAYYTARLLNNKQ